MFDDTQQHNQVKKSESSFLLFCAPNTPINERSEVRGDVGTMRKAQGFSPWRLTADDLTPRLANDGCRGRNMVGEHKKTPKK